MTERINLSEFKKETGFYGSLNLLLTVKSFNLQAIRKRYLKSRKENKSGKTGSVERRQPAMGGIVSLKIEESTITENNVLCKLIEPRGIDVLHHRCAIAAEDIIYIIDAHGNQQQITDPWFSYIHTVYFHPLDPDRILISSSGFDLFKEYSLKEEKVTFEWLAWEHGFRKSRDPETDETTILTRSKEEARKLKQKGHNVHLISNPKTDHLPTAKRAAFINSVQYAEGDPDSFLATFFHEGSVYQINRHSKKAELLMDGLCNPHGAHMQKDKLIATSTSDGEIHILQDDHRKILDLRELEGKDKRLKGHEWVQNTLTHDNLYIAIDSNRTSFIVIDPGQKCYDIIPYNKNWAVQDGCVATLNENQYQKVSELRSPT